MTILEWVDSANLSRTKKNLTRDFSDGVLMAELLKVHLPSLVQIHNYIGSSSKIQKRANWVLLNKKVLSKIGYDMTEDEIENIITCKSNYVEALLKTVYVILKKFKATGGILKQTSNSLQKYRSKSPEVNNGKSKLSQLIGTQNANEEKYKIIINEKDKEIEQLRKRVKLLELEVKTLKETKK